MDKDEQGGSVRELTTFWPNYFAALFGGVTANAGVTKPVESATTQSPADATTVQTSGLLDYLLALSRPYFSMADRFATSNGENPDDALRGWLDNLAQVYVTAAESANTQAQWQTQQGLAIWEYGFAQWQQSMTALFPQRDAVRAPGVNTGATFPKLPGIGYLREMQEQYQQLTRRALEYAAAVQTYNAGVAGVGVRAVEHLRTKLEAQPREVAVDSLRRLYDLWVDTCEEAYAAYAMSEEYSTRYAQMGTAAAALRRQATVVVDNMLEWLNMPTRREVDTLAQRLHETRREIHALRAEIERMKQRGDAPAERRADSTH